MKRLCAAACILFSSLQVFAQDTCSQCCDCSRPDYHAPIGVMIDHGHAQGEWMVSYRYMNMQMRGNLAGSANVDNNYIYQNYLMNGTSMSMQMHMLMVMYGISDRITVMGMGNYVFNRMDMSMMMYGNHMHGGSSMSGNMEMEGTGRTSGFGDTKLYLLYSLLPQKYHQVVASLGVNIPTGSVSGYGTGMMGDRQKQVYSMQTGTGSWEILPGVTYTGQGTRYSWGAQATAGLKVNSNKAGYKLGNELMGNLWIARRWNGWLSNSLRMNAVSVGSIKGFDADIAPLRTTDPGADTNNSGGFYTAVNAGLNIIIPQGFFADNRFGIEYGLPVYQHANGIQMKKRGFLYAGWQYLF